MRRSSLFFALLTLLLGLGLSVLGCGSPRADDDDNDNDDSGSDDDDNDNDDSGSDDDDTPPEWTLTYIFNNIVVSNCGCHAGETHPTGHAFNGDQATLYSVWANAPATQPSPAMDRVEPGNSNASYIIHKLEGTQLSVGGSGFQMPRSGPPYLDPAEIDIIRNWIDLGAQNN